MSAAAIEATDERHDSGHKAVVGLLWVVVLLLGGLFVVDAIGALETEPDECYAYAYGGGPDGSGCNPLLGDAYLEADATQDLVDGQTVHIDGFLFDANSAFGIVQCSGVSFVLEDTPSGIDACDISNVALGSTDADGSLSTNLRVRRIITTPEAGEVDCAEPDADCVIAGGVLGSDGMSTTEAAYLAVTFDPDVAPIQPPTLTIEVADIDADAATLIVDCANATSLSVDVQLQQEIDGLYGSAYGSASFYDEAPPCADGSAELELTLESGSRRIGRGDVSYYIYAYASNGFEGANTSEQGEFRVRRTPRPTYFEVNEPGTDLTLELLGITGRNENQMINLAVTCERPVSGDSDYQNAGLNVQVYQWAGLDRIYGYGGLSLDECDGRTEVEVPIMAGNGRLQTGIAQLEATAYVQSYDPATGDYYYDQARIADKTRLRGRITAEIQEVAENPDSRITIDRVTRSGVTGTIECDEAVNVDLQLSTEQYQGRVIRSNYTYVGAIECDGTTDFEVEWQAPLSRGTTTVNAWANGYTIDDDWEPPTYPTVTYPQVTTTTMGPAAAEPDIGGAMAPRPGFVDADAVVNGHISYVWYDQQGTTVRVRR